MPVFRAILFLLTLATLSGCAAHAKDIYLSTPTEGEALRQVNRDTGSRTVQLVLRDGRSFNAQGAQISPDSTFWQDSGSKREISVSTQDVHRITFKSRKSGAKLGFIIGTLIGLPSGALIYPPKPGDKVTVGERMGAALAGGLGGAVWGVAIGAIAGRQITYFIHPTDSSNVKTEEQR